MDAVMTELKIPEGAFNLDDVVLRSKRMVIVTNTNTVEEAISRACGAWKRGARTAAERKELEEKESAVEQAKQLQFQKLETSAETKLKSEEKLNKAELKLIIRKRSEESEAPAGDTTCKGTKCPVRLSVLEEFKNSYAHPAKVTQMYECKCPKNCGKFCFFVSQRVMLLKNNTQWLLPGIDMSVCLSVCLSLCLCLSICLSVCLRMYNYVYIYHQIISSLCLVLYVRAPCIKINFKNDLPDFVLKHFEA